MGRAIRHIKGKIYHISGVYKSKANAQKDAEANRKHGWQARVLPYAKGHWAVYRRKEK